MSDIEFTWKIFKLEVEPSSNNLTNIVKKVCYEVVGVCKETEEMSGVMDETTLLDPDASKFIPFFELKEETVLNWVKSSIGTQTVFEHENEIKNAILEITKPKLVEMQFPWITNDADKVITFKDKRKRIV